MAFGSERAVALRRERGLNTRRGLVAQAREVLNEQARALDALAERVDDSFCDAVESILTCTGRTVFVGLGKSGLVAQKLAATFASTGTPSLFVHAAEAFHGDLGMIARGDVCILVSASGETKEVVGLLPHLTRMGVPTIALAGRGESTLASQSDVWLDCGVERESCPNNLAPTTSSTATMALGDALAVSLMRCRSFGVTDFARLHPGGTLGRRLTARVRDVMRTNGLPVVPPTATVGESLVVVSEGRLGLVLVMNGDKLVGLVTDGDLRRAMARHQSLLDVSVASIMTENPVTIEEDELLLVAHQRMQQMKLGALVAVDRRGRVAGVVDVFSE